MISNTDIMDNTCVVCFKNVFIFSIGECDHPVCYECSTRMRVLCRQNECPICRQDMSKVIFTNNIQPYKSIDSSSYSLDKKYNICFETETIQKSYNELLAHRCKMCRDYPQFSTFKNLRDHMARIHDRYYCDLCVENLKIFTFERRCYDRSRLYQHSRNGDVDDKSHRGHPLCEFCNCRYMDNDELYRHLRRQHLFCHFCDSEGLNQYYCSYDMLRNHFRSDHYLCEEGPCAEEKFTSVFKTEIDLKAHRASVHCRTIGKAAAKQARTLEVEFTLAPRPRERMMDNRGGKRPNVRSFARLEEEELIGAVGGEELVIPQKAPTIEDFPSLSGQPLPPEPFQIVSRKARNGGVTIRTRKAFQPPLEVTDENFPALASDSGNCNTVRFTVSQDGKRSNRTPNFSIQLNHRPASSGAPPSNNCSSGPPQHLDDFPSLSELKTKPQASAAQWLANHVSNRARFRPADTRYSQSVDDFPSLKTNVSSKSNGKKASSVTIPVSNNWHEKKPNEKVFHSNITTSAINIGSKKKKNSKQNNNENSSAKVKMNEVQSKNKKESTSDEVSNKVPVKKRSELVVDGLSRWEPGGCDDEFPSIGNLIIQSSDKGPPPGFGDSVLKPSNGVKAPPGFSVKLNSVSKVPNSHDNSLTFTNSSGQNFRIEPASQYSYVPPPNFGNRNQELVSCVMKTLKDPESLNKFREMSSQFRKDNLDAKTLYTHCQEIMGHKEFNKIFPEFLVLLPDIAKQQELWALHSSHNGLEICATCQQVVAPEDLTSHLASHTLENHFPSLNSAEPINNAWTRR